jgi:TPR repeat protein
MKRYILTGAIICLLVLTAGGIALWTRVERQRQVDEAIAALKLDQGQVAVQKLEPLARSGDHTAQRELGWIYAVGLGGVERNDNLAIQWFSLAGPMMRNPAKGEDRAADAELWVAYAYANGEQGAVPDKSESLKWLSRSAKGGNPDAVELLGLVNGGANVMDVLKR